MCCCASVSKNITKLAVHPVLYCLPKYNLRDWTVVLRLFIIRSLHYFFNETKIWQLNVIWFTQFVHQIVAGSTIWLIKFVNWSAVGFFEILQEIHFYIVITPPYDLICERHAKFWNLPYMMKYWHNWLIFMVFLFFVWF